MKKLSAVFLSQAIVQAVFATLVSAFMWGSTALAIKHSPDDLTAWIRVAEVFIYVAIPLPAYYRLILMNFGTYGLICPQYYTWSEEYTLSSRGVYNLAKAGDTFYIVTVDDKAPLMVYSTDHFEYKK